MSPSERAASTTRWRSLAALVGLVLLTGLLWLARGPLPTPPVASWAEMRGWYEGLGPAVAAMSGLRVVAAALAGWLTVSVGLQTLTLHVQWARLRWLADLVAPRSLQRLVHGLAGLSLTAGLALPAPSAGILDTPRAGVAILRPVEAPGSGTATLRLLDPVPDEAPPAAPAPVVVPAPTPVPEASPDVVVVEPGDSLWSIAQEALVDAGQPDPDDAAVTAYWRRLIDHNRQMLVAPSNPDLIYAGQVVSLLPVEAGAR